ncbi:MAG: hypothetical protein ACYC23_16355 [Limisphaerales bacterium]
MTSEPIRGRQWEIDKLLERFLGEHIRVAAEPFVPIRWNGEPQPALISTHNLILPD